MSILENLSLNRLEPDDTKKPFQCSNQDLTEFFHIDSSDYGRELLAVTYTFEDEQKVLAYFSVLNDRISYEQIKNGRLPRWVYRHIPNIKRRRSYPAVKVGRLAVHVDFERQGLGTDILDFIKHSFTTGNKTGCRFITVDANNEECVTRFYKKNGFLFLTGEDAKDETRLMFFDLINFHPTE